MTARDRSQGDSIARNAFFALASQGATAVFTAALTLVLVRVLEPSGYGLFALALSAGTLALLPADFGVAQSTARYIAERRGEVGVVASTLAKGLRLKLVLTTVFAGLLVALAGPIASAYGEPGLADPLRGVFIALLGQSVMLLFMRALVALGRVDVQFRLVFLESAVEFSASLGLVLAVGGATGAAFGRAIGYGFGALLGIFLVWRLFGRSPLRVGGEGARYRELAGYATALLVVDGAFALFSQLDVLLLGAILSASSVGIYAAPLRLTTLLHYPGLAAASAVAPRLARHRDRPPDLPALASALRFLVLFQAAVAVVVGVWATPIVDLLLGSDYEESADVLLALAPLIFLKGLGPLASATINYVGEARRRMPVAVGSVILNVVLLFLLVPEIGVVGAAVSVDVAYAVYVGAHVWLCRETLGLKLRPLALTFARAAVASASFALVLIAFGTEEMNVIGGLAGVLAFVAILVASREVSIAELAMAKRWTLSHLRRSS